MSLFSKYKNKRSRSEMIITNKDSSVSEAYTRLKDNILYYNVDGNKKVIQIESSIPGEAKTSVIVNLGVCLGTNNKKVVLLDLDLRRPRIHRLFSIENKDGIADYMLGNIDKAKLIKKTDFTNVDIINRGSQVENSALILTSDKLKNLIEELKSEYDYVLLDCPPVLAVSDYMHIAKLSDGVIFNIAYGITKKNQVRESVSQLRKNNINIIGSIFTFYDPKRSNNYKDYSYYRYGYKSK